VKFIFDHSLSPKLARSLHALVAPQHEAVALKELFPPETENQVWMTQLLQQQNWAFLTVAARGDRSPQELQAWRELGHPIFFLRASWLKLSFWNQSQKLVKFFPTIMEKAAHSSSLFSVSMNGKIEPLTD
jgi:hypothetical protein